MQLDDKTTINCQLRMIRTGLDFDEATAKRLLLLLGSVQAVLEAEKKENSLFYLQCTLPRMNLQFFNLNYKF